MDHGDDLRDCGGRPLAKERPIRRTCTRSTASGSGRVARGRRAVDELANGLLALGIAQGDASRGARADRASSGRSSTSPLRSSGRSARRSTPRAPPRVAQYLLEHSSGRRRPRRGRRAAGEGRGSGVTHVLSFADLDELRERGRAYAPSGLDDLDARVDHDRRGRSVHVHLHLGHDGAAEGLHHPPPQLLRDGRRRPTSCEDRMTERGDVMLLYLPLAHNYGRLLHLLRGVHRIHDRVPARPDTRRRRAAPCPADDLPERAAGVREDSRCGLRPGSASGSGPQAPDRALGALGRLHASRASGRPTARSPRSSPPSTGWPTASSTPRSSPGSAAGCGSRTPAVRRSAAMSPSSSTRSTS